MLQVVARVAKSIFANEDSTKVKIHSSGFEHEAWVTTPVGELEIAGLANDWLHSRNLVINHDYIFSWVSVPGGRDHYRFAFNTAHHSQLFKGHFVRYLVSHNN